MNAKEWLAVEQAAQLLELGDRATLAEVKQAFHRLSKIHHPDVSGGDSEELMYRLTSAYETLIRHYSTYRFPLKREQSDENEPDLYDPEEWWQARFGQDIFWREKKNRR